jgi:hypothetical protein
VLGLGFFLEASSFRTTFSQPPPASLMAESPQQPKERDGVVSTLNVFIEAFTLAKEISSITPAKAVFGSAAVILTTIKVCFFLLYVTASLRLAFVIQEFFANQQDYIELGQNCVEICCVLDRGTKGKGAEHFSQLVQDAINRLETWVESGVCRLDS